MQSPRRSIATKLYAIFALLASVTAAMGAWTLVAAYWYLDLAPLDGAGGMTALAAGLAVAAIVLAVAGVIIVAVGVAQPLARIGRAAEAVAAGNTQAVIPDRDRNDEIGALARTIAHLQDALRQNQELDRSLTEQRELRAPPAGGAIGRAEPLRRRDRIDPGGAGPHLGRDDRSPPPRSRARRIPPRRAPPGPSAASSEASANVRDIASAADELAASVSEIDRQVAQSNAIATKAVTEAEWTSATVKELNEAAGRIGDVVKLITDIAEQTNLLALNATIEAARAGEYGRGFAVVASEVKALAGQTAKATEDISAQIAGMQQATMRSISAIGAIERTIREIGSISGAIAAAVTEQGAATQEIARSVETAAKRTIETASEVGRAGDATATTRSNAITVKSVADDLGRGRRRIRGQVDQFFHKLRAA